MRTRANVALKLPADMQLIQVPMIVGDSCTARPSLMIQLPPLDGAGSAGVNPLSFVRENKLTRIRTASEPKGVQGVGNEDADAQYNDNSDDGPKPNSFLHERLQ
jgi:hypothetical protein